MTKYINFASVKMWFSMVLQVVRVTHCGASTLGPRVSSWPIPSLRTVHSAALSLCLQSKAFPSKASLSLISLILPPSPSLGLILLCVSVSFIPFPSLNGCLSFLPSLWQYESRPAPSPPSRCSRQGWRSALHLGCVYPRSLPLCSQRRV